VTTFGDAIATAPDLRKIILDNDDVRMLLVTVAPGASAAMHTHPRNINYVVGGGKLRFSTPDGQVREVELFEGQVIEAQATVHQVENVGETVVQTIQTEFKT
jgi:quercetin dioxygenase-like cupin family protein